MNRIKSIKEVFGDEGPYDGFIIETEDETIKLLISNGYNCCEEWGYFLSEDDVNSFIGSVILSISLTDSGLVTKKLESLEEKLNEPLSVMFVTIETNSGTLQFTAYNSHNGYYAHEGCVISRELNHKENL